MSVSEIFVCKHCGKEHEASTQEVGSYMCPNQSYLKRKGKVLDSVSLKQLTELNGLSQTQDPNANLTEEGFQHDTNKQQSSDSQEAVQKPCAGRNACPNGNQAND